MAKLKKGEIIEADLEEYLAHHSDFGFELKILRALSESGIRCDHGGVYEDPVTKKTREFDIRARITRSDRRVRASVECKSLRSYFPVLISCLPRRDDESYHDVAVCREREQSYDRLGAGMFVSRATIVRLCYENTIYAPGEPVGKSIAQVGRSTDNALVANDSEIHEKWGQCLSSAHDLVGEMYYDGGPEDDHFTMLSAVIPIVVVPDDMLWTVHFDDNGNVVRPPMREHRCACFVGKEYSTGSNLAGARIALSHVEVLTATGMELFAAEYLMSDPGLEKLFPREAISTGLGVESM